MRKNSEIILSSIIVMCFVAPAMAAHQISATFPDASQGEYMQADYTYTGAATATNMAGVTEGSVNAVAQYEDIQYTVGAGKYLPAGGEAVVDCDVANSFCPGLPNDVLYDADNAQGLTSCSSATNGNYTLSDGTGSSSTSCYRTCTTGDVAHSANVTGMVYYNGTDGDGVKACAPTSANGCETGYHYVAAVAGIGVDLTTEIGLTDGTTNFGYKSNSGTGLNSDAARLAQYGITENGTFVVDYGDGKMIRGKSQCSTRSATNPWVHNAYVLQSNSIASELPNSSGKYCYCQLDGYALNGMDAMQELSAIQGLSVPWVFDRAFNNDGTCADNCAIYCADDLRNGDSGVTQFRAVVFESVPLGYPAMCEANTITINWGDTDSDDVTANNAGTATYGEDIRTPLKAQTKTGKTFKGWRFVAPTPASPEP